MKHEITIKRVYEPASAQDGYRIYIDRLWPRGLSHETFHYDWWDKQLAPSTVLREWFHAEPENRWPEFVNRYMVELTENSAFEELMKAIADKDKVTLLYSSHDRQHNNAVVMEQMLELHGWTNVSDTNPA